ncbi:DUF4397 domain-containing protein [Halopiger aswanensis]|uniref:Uncharacterized protein DUF4397 n=1 Tax=Halopiger aswanensis TaxID=148449 RepID=A0A3R7GUD7_9EURY|nr:DUF4397 domain-containing protein [Halopiger aswanensis]RKD93566.1 uncharacterized protein DUF4397 [Halopiger aswanensis]
MPVSRRTALKSLGVAGGLTAASGTVFATGEHESDERSKQKKGGTAGDEHEQATDVPAAAVRVAHFSPDAPNVDVYVDWTRVLEDVPYGEISPYLEVEPGTYTVTITPAGDPETKAFEGEVTVGSGFYTVAAIGELGAGTFRPEVLTDAGSALVRAFHASPDAPAVDVYADGEPLFTNLSFGESTNYLAVPAGSYSLSLRPAGDAETVVAEFDATVEAGTAYTASAIGYLQPPADAADRGLEAAISVDGAMSASDD